MPTGFDPIAGPDARVLVLGTMPSVRSLALGEYYGHPRNAFWPIMRELFATGEALDYAARTALLLASRVAVWDVLHSALRPGSLDAHIVPESVIVNDIGGFLTAHAGIASVFFNGAAAEKLFLRHVRPCQLISPALSFHRLPSTSPANASLSLADKLAAWAPLRIAVGAGPCHSSTKSQSQGFICK